MPRLGKSRSRFLKSQNKSLWAVACHEAGHALAKWIHGRRIKEITVVPEGDFLGRVKGDAPTPDACGYLENCSCFEDRAAAGREARWHQDIVVLLAGMAAERLLAQNRDVTSGGASDLEAVNYILFRMYPDSEARLVFKWLEVRAKNLMARAVHQEMIKDLAEALLCLRKIRGKDAVAILRWSLDRHTLKTESPSWMNQLPVCLKWTQSGFEKPNIVSK